MLPSSKAAVKTCAKFFLVDTRSQTGIFVKNIFSLKPFCHLLVAEIHLEGIMRVRQFLVE